ncbi:MAG TPA: hypothetical protein PK306_14410 [Aquabacterium sp.]|nr:hypothetical protein [Aquabacterium sp.]
MAMHMAVKQAICGGVILRIGRALQSGFVADCDLQGMGAGRPQVSESFTGRGPEFTRSFASG